MNREVRSMICPNCRLLISRDEKSCPHCGLTRPAAWRKSRILAGLFDHPERLVKSVIYVNMAMYILSLILNPWTGHPTANPLSLFTPSSRSLLLLGGTGSLPIEGLHRWWTLISASYLHGGILHILFNMVVFWQLAPVVLKEFGAYRMFVIYTLGGAGGYLLSYWGGTTLTVGASAAVFGMIGAILYFALSQGGPYGTALFKQIAMWVVLIFLFGFLVRGVDNWGHAGGMVAGAVLGFLLGFNQRSRERLFHKILANLCAVLTIFILAGAAGSALYYRYLI